MKIENEEITRLLLKIITKNEACHQRQLNIVFIPCSSVLKTVISDNYKSYIHTILSFNEFRCSYDSLIKIVGIRVLSKKLTARTTKMSPENPWDSWLAQCLISRSLQSVFVADMIRMPSVPGKSTPR